jgi:hypothetical protein
MNWDRLEGKWKPYSGKVKEKRSVVLASPESEPA